MDKKGLWEAILLDLAPLIGKPQLFSLFKDSVIMTEENGTITVGVPSPIALTFIRQKFEVRIFESAKRILPETREVVYEVHGSLVEEKHPNKIDLKLFSQVSDRKPVRKIPNRQEVVMEDGMRSKMFNPKYTLQNFLPGNENRLAHAACMAVAAKPGDIYNPLYLYGGVGLGKTHLLQGTGIEISRNYQGKNVVYMTSEKFTNEVVEAIGSRHTKSFKERYRNVDCLIVDDIQFFAGKTKTEEEFFHLFNSFYDNNKQIIFSSDKHPNFILGLEDRLKSRLNSGMIVEIPSPDLESRIQIFKVKSKMLNFSLSDEIIEYLASSVEGNIRELEGVLNSIICQSKLRGRDLTINEIKDLIKNNLKPKKNSSIKDVIKMIAEYYGITEGEVYEKTRKKAVVKPRQVIMYILREDFDVSYPTIGEKLGGKDHTTVMHSYEKVKEDLKTNSSLVRELSQIRSMIT